MSIYLFRESFHTDSIDMSSKLYHLLNTFQNENKSLSNTSPCNNTMDSLYGTTCESMSTNTTFTEQVADHLQDIELRDYQKQVPIA